MAQRRQHESQQVAQLLKILASNGGGNNTKKSRKKTDSSNSSSKHRNKRRSDQGTSNSNSNKKKNKKQQKGESPGKEGGHGSSGRNSKWNLALPHVSNLNAHNFPAVSGFSQRRHSLLLEHLWTVIDKQFPDPPDPGIDPSDDLVIPDADQFPPEIDLQSTCVNLSWMLLTLYDRLSNIESFQPSVQQSFAPPSSVAMGATILDQFLAGIADIVSRRQGDHLQDVLQVLPVKMRDSYHHMANELQATYPSGQGDDALLKRCETLVPKTSDGSTTWPAFPIFIRSYLAYLRDGDVSNPLKAHKFMSLLLNQCMQALGDSQMGAIVLRTVVYLSQIVASLAVTVEKTPQLLAELQGYGSQDAFQRPNLLENAANVVREGFIKCLTDRGGTTNQQGKPEGKRAGIYLMVNQCLKLLDRSGNLRSADTIFKSIVSQSPPLEYYPASQRVTYLYYLGRYLFGSGRFFPAQKALWEAYMKCHVNCIKQKRRILIYLISCNIIMGRFPSMQLLQKPEARGLYDIFVPLCRLIRSGDYLSFRDYFKLGTPIAKWYLKMGMLYQMRNRCELLVWRSLIRKVFLHGGFQGDPTAQRSPPPMLHLNKLEAAVRFIQARHKANSHAAVAGDATNGPSTFTLDAPIDHDYQGIAKFVPHISDPEDRDYLCPSGYYDEDGAWVENPMGQRVFGHEGKEYVGDVKELLPYIAENVSSEPASNLLQDIESIVASLIKQSLLGGYLTHNPARFVIPGAKHVGAMAKGFPNIWQVISTQQESYGNTVPGWVVRHVTFEQPGISAGGGRVISLKGAKAVGS